MRIDCVLEGRAVPIAPLPDVEGKLYPSKKAGPEKSSKVMGAPESGTIEHAGCGTERLNREDINRSSIGPSLGSLGTSIPMSISVTDSEESRRRRFAGCTSTSSEARLFRERPS